MTLKTKTYQRIAIALVFFINGFASGNWATRLPEIQTNLGIDNATLGSALLFASVGSIFAMPFTGWLTVQYGSRNISIFSSISFSIAFVLMPFIHSVWVLRGVFFIIGAMNGSLDVAMNSQAVVVEKAYGRPIMSSFHAVFSGGMMIGAWSSSLFTACHSSLSVHFFSIAVFNLMLLFWAVRHFIKDKPTKEDDGDAPLFRLPNKALAAFGLIAFCCMLGEGSMADWSAIYIHKSLGASLALAPLGVGAFSMAMLLGRSIGDKVIERYGYRDVLIVSSLISAVGLLAALSVEQVYVAISGFFIVELGLATIVPICYSRAGNTEGISPSVGLAMVTTVGYAGFLFGPPIIGYLADWQSLRIALYFVVGLFGLSAVLALRLKRV